MLAERGDIILARKVAMDYLTNLERKADGDDRVPLGAERVKFQYARLIGVQAYLVLNWGLADRLVGAFGRMLCPLTRA